MKPFLTRWLLTTIAVFIVAHLRVGISYDSLSALIGAALILGIVNATIRPVLLLLCLPLILVSLGFFILIVNALMLRLAGGLVPGFYVDSFAGAFISSILISIVSWVLSAFFRGSDGRVHVLTHHSQIKPVRGRVVE